MIDEEHLNNWLQKQVARCEKEIDRGGDFYNLSTEKEAYEKVTEKVDSMRKR